MENRRLIVWKCVGRYTFQSCHLEHYSLSILPPYLPYLHMYNTIRRIPALYITDAIEEKTMASFSLSQSHHRVRIFHETHNTPCSFSRSSNDARNTQLLQSLLRGVNESGPILVHHGQLIFLVRHKSTKTRKK